MKPPPGQSYSVLVLSQGGQYGAYGGGFIEAWGNRPDLQPNRAEVDVITGVSTGAVMASFVYLGSSDDAATRARYDAFLKSLYTRTIGNDLVRKRSWIELLAGANGLADPAGLRAWIASIVTPELLAAITAEHDASKRLMLAGAVNADSGLFEVFDLVAIARSGNTACYANAIAASAAIPGALDPVFINDRMYIDGGARQALFFVENTGKALPATASKNLFGIVHSQIDVGPERTRNNLIGVAGRTLQMLMKQTIADSVYHVDSEARRLGFTTRWTSTAKVDCPTSNDEDFFDPALGTCLWNAGAARATGDTMPWKELAQIRDP
jgi:predicted acylesterase/phospholipase RssA